MKVSPLQWRRQDFFRGATPRPLKGYHAPPAGGPGAKAPRTVAKFHFFKRCKVLENDSSFQKYQYFSCPKNLFFLRKNSKNRTYLTGMSEFFRIFIEKFSILMNPINPEKFSVNSIIRLRNLPWRRVEFFWRDPIKQKKFPMNSIMKLRNVSKS